uniref:Secreted protein n=1 Tax=Syphacia muris TaxID=451379 RepID=A0A0N5AD84_9BILA
MIRTSRRRCTELRWSTVMDTAAALMTPAPLPPRLLSSCNQNPHFFLDAATAAAAEVFAKLQLLLDALNDA